MKKIIINNITNELFKTFKSLFPLEITKNNEQFEIELSHDKREIWAFPLVAGTEDLDSAIHSIEEHRKVIPAALYRSANETDGAFLVGYYAKKIKNDELEHGLVIIPSNRTSKNENSEVLTSYCFEREKLYKNIFHEEYFKQINSFLQNYKSVCKKYWIQDTKLLNTTFLERPLSNNEDSTENRASTSTWNTEVYPDFMRPITMIGDIYIDFMLCLISLQSEIEEEDSIWDLFEEEDIKEIYSMPSTLTYNTFQSDIKGWCRTTSYELSERKDFNYRTIFEIAVPNLKGSLINQGLSIGWCGKVAFLGIGLDKPLYISPGFLEKIEDISDFEQISFDNKAFWRNRDIDFRKNVSSHNIVKVCDDLMTEKETKSKLLEACKKALQSCKNPLKEVQKGINKYVTRYLKGLARGTEEKQASDYLNLINSVKLCADEQEILYKIIEWIE